MVGKIKIGTELDTKSFDKQIEELQDKIDDLEKQKLYFSVHGMTGELKEVEVELEKTQNKLVQLNAQKQKLEQTTGLENIGKSFRDAVKHASRLVLGIFGVRTAYMTLRNASSYLSQYDEQYAANLEYIRYVLTQAIAPVLRGIVQLAMQLLQLINMIVNALFGINLFSNGSAENFRKMKAGASGVSKAVKEIKKQLLGFDEINVLTDQSDTGTSAGAGGVKTPDIDLSEIQGERPQWMQWIIDNGPMLLTILGGIFAFLSIKKIGKFLGQTLGLGKVLTKIKDIISLGLGKALIKIKDVISTVFKVISANKGVFAGILVAALGIVDALDGIVKYIQDPSWGNFGQIIRGIGIAISGFGIVVGSIPAIVAGAVVLIFSTVVKYWDKIKEFLQKGIDWLVGKTDWVREHFGKVGEGIYNIFTGLLQSILNIFDSILSNFKKMFDGLITFLKGVFTGNWKQAWEGVRQIFTSVFDAIKGVIESVWTFIKTLFSAGGKIFVGITEGIVGAFKAIVNALIWGINKIIATPFNVINGLLNKIKSVDIMGLKPFDGFWGWNPLPVPQIPQLKTGGIINMPNKGTMLGGMAIGGEAGKERYYSSYRPRGHE